MATLTEYLFHSVVFLALVKSCSAYCYGYCWYGSWYIWFGVVMTIAICCGALGSYLRRRRIQRALRERQTGVVAVVDGMPVQATSDLPRPYVYPQGPYNPQGGAPVPGSFPPPGGYPAQGPDAMVPPPYSALVTEEQQKKQPPPETQPPSYGEAIANQHSNPGTPYASPYPAQPQPYPAQPQPYPTQPQPYPTQPQPQPMVPPSGESTTQGRPYPSAP